MKTTQVIPSLHLLFALKCFYQYSHGIADRMMSGIKGMGLLLQSLHDLHPAIPTPSCSVSFHGHLYIPFWEMYFYTCEYMDDGYTVCGIFKHIHTLVSGS